VPQADDLVLDSELFAFQLEDTEAVWKGSVVFFVYGLFELGVLDGERGKTSLNVHVVDPR
jgi:hypothetical protein